MQFLSENHLNRCQIFGWSGFYKPNFGFPYIPTVQNSNYHVYYKQDNTAGTSNLASQVHDNKEQSFDEEQLMSKNPLHWQVLTQKLDADAATISIRPNTLNHGHLHTVNVFSFIS